MSRLPSRSCGNRLPGPALLLCGLVLLVVTTPAHAGIGDLVKKAKEKATKTVAPAEEKAGGSEKPCKVEFDAVVLELTEARVAGILATFQAAGEAGAGRPALVEKLNQVLEEENAIREKHYEKMQAARDKRAEVESCYHDAYKEVGDRKMHEYAQRAMSDPALMAKYSKLAKENQAAMSGDSAASDRIMKGMYEEMLPSKEDSAAVRKKCGPVVPKLAEETRMEELEKQEKEYYAKIAAVDDKVAKVQAKQSGMDPGQWHMALERIQMYLNLERNKREKAIGCAYSKVEIAAIEKNLEQLKAKVG